MDKWLWAARFFKTRALAARSCEMGRIESNGIAAKSSRDVRIGDKLRVRNDGGEFEIEVVGLSDMRGPAAQAQALYRETDQSREARAQLLMQRKLMPAPLPLGEGRPSKRDRRELDRFRHRF